MKRIKVIYKQGEGFFIETLKDERFIRHIPEKEKTFDWLLKIPQINKSDVLEILEYFLLSDITGFTEWRESDEIFNFPFSNHSNAYNYETKRFKFNEPIPSFESEYFNILGTLFLAGYVDFVAECPKNTYLSQYKEDKYQAWIYFRDNFLYQEAFNKSPEDDILIYEGKEYTEKNCPHYVKNGIIHYLGYRTLYKTSWDTPKYWSQYNILVARTPKAMEYIKILDEGLYNKYKDLEVEIDDKGNIIQWIGEIHR